MGLYRVELSEDDVMFEDGDGGDTVGEYNRFELLLILVKNLMGRFKEEFK